MTQRLVIDALMMALLQRRPGLGLIVHSDRGSQYASAGYRKLLKARQFLQSMCRKGDCWDNALWPNDRSANESFFATLKLELIYHRRYGSCQEAKSDIFEWMAVFYNRKRMHSKLDYQSPARYEAQTAALAA